MRTKSNKIFLVFSWCFVFACMIIIFWFSHRTASDSSEQSEGVIKRLFDLFGIELSQHIVRKTAHALEYFGLCLAFNSAYGFTYLKYCPLISLSSSVFYACTDEIHQYFIDGRACQLRDVFVDFCGALACTAAVALIYFVYKHFKEKER